MYVIDIRCRHVRGLGLWLGLLFYTGGVLYIEKWCIRQAALMFFYHILKQHHHRTWPIYLYWYQLTNIHIYNLYVCRVRSTSTRYTPTTGRSPTKAPSPSEAMPT